MQKISKSTDILFIADTISKYRKKTDIKNADTIRYQYDTDNIGIADIIDDTNTIDPSLQGVPSR